MRQAPQSPEAQPSFEPVRPSGPRSASSMVSLGSQRNSIGSPLMGGETCSLAMVFNSLTLIFLRALGGDGGRALPQHPPNFGSVRDGAALVVARTAGGGAHRGGGLHRPIVVP